MRFKLTHQDITQMEVDAIVNAANPGLQRGGGVCGAIFEAAGGKNLQEACDQIGNCHVGEAVITSGFNARARYIIHAVGPIWHGGQNDEPKLLASAYRKALELAVEHQCESIAFPLISAGIYGYPKELAFRVAVNAIEKFVGNHEIQVYLVVFDKNALGLKEGLKQSIDAYLKSHYEAQSPLLSQDLMMAEASVLPAYKMVKTDQQLEDLMNQLDESFVQYLFRLIDESGLTDVETYKRANIDRRLFSKFRNEPYYTPSKMTTISFGIALELSLEDLSKLLSKAGYALSRSSQLDLIIQYFIENKIYNIYEINEVLFAYDHPLLGA